MEWVATLFSLAEDFNNIAEALSDKPNYYTEMVKYADKLDFCIYVKNSAGDEYRLNDASKALDMLQ